MCGCYYVQTQRWSEVVFINRSHAFIQDSWNERCLIRGKCSVLGVPVGILITSALKMQPPSPTHPPVCSRTPNKVTGVQDRIASLQTRTWPRVIHVITSWIKHLGLPSSTIKSPDWHDLFVPRASHPNTELGCWFLLEHTQSPLTRIKDVRTFGHCRLPYSCCLLRVYDSKMSQNQEFYRLHSKVKAEVL